MRKVLLVDDESWVIESLKDLVQWEAHGYEVVAQANSGADALEAMRLHRPDVVFTDIRMPEINGLELIRRGKAMPSPAQFVVVSGYAEFAYAQKALAYGAVAYCLKPFDEIEIVGVLAKLNKMFAAAASASEDADDYTLLHLLEESAGGRERRSEDGGPDVRERTQAESEASGSERLLEQLARRGLTDWEGEGVAAVVAVGSGEPSGLDGRAVRVKIGTLKTAYLLRYGQAEAAAGRWAEQFPPGLAGIGVSARIGNPAELKGAIDAADVLAHQFFVTGSPGVFLPHPQQQQDLNEQMLRMSEAIGGKDLKEVGRVFERLVGLFEAGGLSIRHAFQVYNMTLSFLFKLGQTENMLYSYEQLTPAFSNVRDMLAGLGNLAASHLGQPDALPHPVETKNQTFNAILQHVTTHFREEMSLQALSEQFFMNPSYISQLFKKEVGETFTAYVARLRIAHACELLEQDGLSVQEVAERIGYLDYFYFARLFKKTTGKTPTQYRAERGQIRDAMDLF